MLTVTDWIMFNVINKVFTKEEWHAVWAGFFDGISVKKEGKWTRKLAKKAGVKHHYVLEKTHYYNMSYNVGEYSKLIFIGVLARYGLIQ